MADADCVPDYSNKSVEELWAEWKVQHNKTYGSKEEESRRFDIFKTSKNRIEEHNEKYKNGKTTFVMGLNEFADLEPHEVCGCMSNKRRCGKREK